MPKVSDPAFREIVQALKQYEAEVERSKMAPTTKQAYLSHARDFVRWLRDEFKPGERTG